RLLGRPISTVHRGCSFTYGDTREPVPRHTYASLAKATVARWLASPKHRASLLSGSFQRLGAGVAADPKGPACGDFYLVQTFAD
ncbi:MAG TPA: CAP domain-containing protein, partial [Amaricoccus sp.]|nr:CAP domain-containing protein [Amaricoccus sp.]